MMSGGGMGGGMGGGGNRTRMLSTNMDDLKLSNLKSQNLKRMWDLLSPHVWKLALALLFMLTVSATGLAGPYLLKLAIDEYIAKGDLPGLTTVSILYTVIYIVNWAGTYWQVYIISMVGQSIIVDLRRKLFAHVQTLGLKFYDEVQAGRLMSRITNDIDALNQLVSSGLTNLVNDVLTVFGIAAIMFYMDWRLALVSFITLPMLVLLVTVYQARMTRAFWQVRSRVADVNAVLQESISGMKVVQAFSREDQNMQMFSGTNTGNMLANLRAAVLHSAFFPLVEVIGAIGTAAVLWYGGIQISRQGVTVGTLVAFLAYVTRFFWPIRDISQVYNMFLGAAVATERVFEVLDHEPTIVDKPGALELKTSTGHVRLEDVTFGYEKDQPILKKVNIEVSPGETIALVGPTGAGKTSVINMVSRFYDPWDGRVLIDGHDLRDVTQLSLHQQLGIVLQDTFIFSGTIADNIRYGRLEATDDEVIAAAKAVNAHDFIMRFPDGYQTEVQERGSKLSVGQRQLIAFARAILADPKVLILDEATSSVDAYTEMLIQEALDVLLRGRTSIVIAHRLSTIRNATRIYVIDHGEVVQVGSHEALLTAGGLYKDLYEKQFSEVQHIAS
jgi:ATP-binding cassette, subfamily B, multidrug efflux pump